MKTEYSVECEKCGSYNISPIKCESCWKKEQEKAISEQKQKFLDVVDKMKPKKGVMFFSDWFEELKSELEKMK